MKASDLIKILETMIEIHGDLQVFIESVHSIDSIEYRDKLDKLSLPERFNIITK